MATNGLTGIKSITTYLLLLILGIFLCDCSSRYDDEITVFQPEPVHFSKNWKAHFGSPAIDENFERLNIYRQSNGYLVAFLPVDYGLLQSISSDNGESWTKPQLVFSYPKSVSPVFVNGRLIGVMSVDKVANGGQMYFHARRGDSWDISGSIRDTHWGDFSDQSFAFDSSGNLYCAWADWREGNSDIYFSVSKDGGKTWRSNIRIDDDQSGQEQRAPIVLSTPEGILHILWEDNRNPDTLFDIYFSTSVDGGRTWSPNSKVNDDTTWTWQIAPSVVLDAHGNLYATWTDYRDRGEGGEVTANIYFARFQNNGIGWSANVRISDARYGQNLYPKLQGKPDGRLYCTWMNSEDNQQNDIFFSYSSDSGQSWSVPVRVNDDTKRAAHYHRNIGWLGYDSEEKGIAGWIDWRSGEPEVYFAQALDQPDISRPQRAPIETPNAFDTQTIAVEFDVQSDTLFHDDFVENPSSHWNVHSGTWVYRDQQYIGYGAPESSNFIGSESWNNYSFQGRFRLDKIAHQSAILYIRVNTDERGAMRYYQIHNYFRRGVTVEYFDGMSLLPVTDRPYPFQQDRWYTFRAVVRENVLYYFIDEILVLVSDDFTHLYRGHIGIGTEYHPTYFKDIVVTAIE